MSEAAVTVRAPAKLNLTLEVIERLPNGFHLIRSIFARVDSISDTLTIGVHRAGAGVHISTDATDIPLDDANICHQAAARYLAAINAVARIDIRIDKKIPVAAGLGGGSSDAAAVLRVLNDVFGGRLLPPELSTLGAGLGKDIPFFLAGVPAAIVSGMGEIVEPLPSLPPFEYLVVNPMVPIPTGEAYAALGQAVPFMTDPSRFNVTEHMKHSIEAGDRAAVAAGLYNEFETYAERRYPVVRQLQQTLRALGARAARMSGSGPTVFGLFDTADQCLAAARAMRHYYPTMRILHGGAGMHDRIIAA